MSHKAIAVFAIFKIDVGQFSASLVEKNLLNQITAINQAMRKAKPVLIHKF